jgi:chromosome partitioning protein
MPFVVSFVSQKGGPGKTTTVTSTAVAAAGDGLRTLIFDVDPQRSAETWYQKRQADEPLLVACEAVKLKEGLSKVQEKQSHDSVFIDTPGHHSPGTADAITLSDLCIVPCRPSGPDLNAMKDTVAMIDRLNKPFVFLITQAKPLRKKLIGSGKIPNVRTVEAKDALIKRFGGKKKDDIVVPGQITELVTFEDAYSAGEGVTEYEPNGAAAEEILTLWSWIKKASGVENGQEKNVA